MAPNKRRSSDMEPEPFPEGMVCRNVPEVFQIFHNAQYNTVQHRKYAKALEKIYKKIGMEGFRESFSNALHFTFRFGEANGYVDRVLQFVAEFCGRLSEDEDFLAYIFEVIFECTSVVGQGVRSRSCQLMGLILSALGEDASLDDNICDKILSTQLERLQDIRGAVRCWAAVTLQRLQNPTDESDPVTKAYIFHMSCDPSSAVRRTVILHLAKSSRNLLYVLERLCDVDENVRRAAFLYVSSINVTQLKVRQRIHILKIGLAERSPRVRRVVETTLLPGWLGGYRGNVLDLLAAIRLDNIQGAKDSAAVTADLLQMIFKLRQPSELVEWLPIDPETKLIPPDRLTKDSARYWSHLVQYLHSINETERLEETLPELIKFTDYVRIFVEDPWPERSNQQDYAKHQSVLCEFVNVFGVYDMSDEAGRVALQTLLYDALMSQYGLLDEEVVRAMMRIAELIIPKLENRIEFVMGIICETHEPAEEVIIAPQETVESNEIKMLRAKLRISLNEALEEQEEAVRARDFIAAANYKVKVDDLHRQLEEFNANLKPQQAPIVEKVKEMRDDPETLNKCLLLLNTLLDTPQISTLSPTLKSLFDRFEMQIFQNQAIRENALKTIALYSVLDEEFAKEHKAFFFAQFMDIDNEPLVIVALKCVIDIMAIHGVKIFNIDQPANESRRNKSNALSRSNKTAHNSDDSDDEEEVDVSTVVSTQDTIIELFLRFLNSESSDYRAIVVEGFCRLLMAGHITSSKLVGRLILLWFNPATEEEDYLRQMLGTFFPLFATHVEDAQEQLEAAFIPTLTTLADAPNDSPLSEVDMDIVIKFLIGLTLPTVSPTAHNVHSNLCMLICKALEKGAELAEPVLCRALTQLAPPKTKDLCEDLLHSTRGIAEMMVDKASLRNLNKFQATLIITIEELEKRPSMNMIPEITEPSTLINALCRESDAQSDGRPSDSNSKTSEIDSVPPENSPRTDDSRKSIEPPSPIRSPPKKIQAMTASEVAKCAVRTSTRARTPRSTPSASKQTKNGPSKPTPKASTRSLDKQLEKASVKKKPTKKPTKRAPKKVETKESESDSSEVDIQNQSSDDDTKLYTICHNLSENVSIMESSSSDDEATFRRSKPAVNIPASDSDDSSSDDDRSILVRRK